MKILFLCVANSARSQLAQVFAQDIYRKKSLDTQLIQSAGSSPSGKVNPLAIEVLEEAGFTEVGDTLHSNSIEELEKSFVAELDFVITLCSDEVCPVLNSNAVRLHWPYPDPHTKEDFQIIASQIQVRLLDFINEKI